MLSYKPPKQAMNASSIYKAINGRDQVFSFQDSLRNRYDTRYQRISAIVKKKEDLLKDKSKLMIDVKRSSADSSKKTWLYTTKHNRNQKDYSGMKIGKGYINDENSLACPSQILQGEKTVECPEYECSKEPTTTNTTAYLSNTLKGYSQKKGSFKRIEPESKNHLIKMRDLSVKERRTYNNLFYNNVSNTSKEISTINNHTNSNNNDDTSLIGASWNTNSINIITTHIINNNSNNNAISASSTTAYITPLVIVNKIPLLSGNSSSGMKKHTTSPKIMSKENKDEENNDMFHYDEERQCELTDDEKSIYGQREMKFHKKQRLLGKGGCGIVWLCLNEETNSLCAVKQIAKKTKDSPLNSLVQIARNEIEILSKLNRHYKSKYIVDIYNFYEDYNDIWFSFELGGKSLSSLTFKVKGDFINNERIYLIKKGYFLLMLFSKEDKSLMQFKRMIRSILEGIQFISSQGISHADIKPENILIEYEGDSYESFMVKAVKIIDFGSAFNVKKPGSLSSNTPEYMCPEITELMEMTCYNKEKAKFLKELPEYPWVVDMWSLGVTLLELVLCCPIWMSYKAKVNINGKSLYKTGLFGFKGRDGQKIHQKQIEVSHSLKKLLNQSLLAKSIEREDFEDLLSKMLHTNYKQRISPCDALEHPFLAI